MATLTARVKDYETRGLAKRKDQTLADLFAERSALYTKYADITIECDGAGHEAVCSMIMDAIENLC
jgi:shikimate kinase